MLNVCNLVEIDAVRAGAFSSSRRAVTDALQKIYLDNLQKYRLKV